MTDEEFFALTPRQFSYLSNRQKWRREHDEFMIAQLTSWVANTGFKTTKKPSEPRDFMPSHFGKAKPEEPTKPQPTKRRSRKTITFELQNVMQHFMRTSK